MQNLQLVYVSLSYYIQNWLSLELSLTAEAIDLWLRRSVTHFHPLISWTSNFFWFVSALIRKQYVYVAGIHFHWEVQVCTLSDASIMAILFSCHLQWFGIQLLTLLIKICMYTCTYSMSNVAVMLSYLSQDLRFTSKFYFNRCSFTDIFAWTAKIDYFKNHAIIVTFCLSWSRQSFIELNLTGKTSSLWSSLVDQSLL